MQKGEKILNEEYYILINKDKQIQKQSDADFFLDIADIETARKCKEPDQVIVKVKVKWEVVEE